MIFKAACVAGSAIVGLIAGIGPADAHWQYTKWGMSAEQLLSASEGSATVGSGVKSVQGDAVKGASGRYATGSYNFDADFWFGASGLSMVSLKMRDNVQCLGLQRDLLAKYGEPVEKTGGAVQRRMWPDKAANNRVVLITTDLNFCELQYAPLVSEASSGL